MMMGSPEDTCSVYSEYYSTYTGPELVKATIDNLDCLSTIKMFYGLNNNWNKKLWTTRDIFDNDEWILDKELYLEFKSGNGRVHWMRCRIETMDNIINPPLFTPFDESHNRQN